MAWIPAKFDHSLVTTNCGSCHDGSRATGKGPAHMQTGDVSEDCHVVTAWKPVLKVDHNQVLGSCVSCHDGMTAQGKTPDHIASDDGCAACHSMLEWSGAK